MKKKIKNFYSKILSNLNKKNKTFYKYNSTNISYFDILKKIERFHYIIKKEKFRKIALYCDKSENYYAAVIAILMSGKTWIQLSKNNPKNRNLSIINETSIDLILSDEKFHIFKKKKVKFINEIAESNFILKLPNKCPIKSKELSCIFFTSGSTGIPKGVKISYSSMIESLSHQIKNLGYSTSDTFSDFHESSFVMSLNTILPCIQLGASITPFKEENDKMFGAEIIKKNNVSVLITVPSYILFLKNLIKKKIIIKNIILCGESFSLNTFNIIKNKYKFKNLYNCYGATELSPWAFSYKFSRKDEKIIKKKTQVPIGVPFNGVKIKKSKTGEMLISGDILSSGYLRKKQNLDKFIKIKKRNYYNTGDLFEKYKDKYFILGRNDKQIKLNGYRINLLDIDANLRKLQSINFSFSYLKNNLIHTIYSSDRKISDKIIKSCLVKNLPNYMLPKKLIYISKIKFNKNGKIDRNFLISKYS